MSRKLLGSLRLRPHKIAERLTLTALLMLMLETPGQAQTWSNKVTTTPPLIQIDFGPYGDRLPGDGQSYCGPTSAAIMQEWLISNGYSQLVAAESNGGSENLVTVIGAMAGVSATNGTNPGEMQNALSTYLAAKGMSSAFVGNTQLDAPNNTLTDALMELDKLIEDQGVAILSSTYLNATTGSGSDGHDVALVGVNLATQELTIRNPYPTAFETGVSDTPAFSLQTFKLKKSNVNGTDHFVLETSAPDPAEFLVSPISATHWKPTLAQLPSDASYTIETWELNSNGSGAALGVIDTGTGVFDLIAPLADSSAPGATPGGLTKQGEGTLFLRNLQPSTTVAANTTSGTNSLEGGWTVATQTSGTPLGTGSVDMKFGGSLEFRPDDSNPLSSSFTLAADGTLTYFGGNTIKLSRGANTDLTVTVGGNDGTAPNFERGDQGTLTLEVTEGLSALGGAVKLKANGSGGNLPTLTNGMVTPTIVGRDADGTGAFLTYDVTNGFERAVLTDSLGTDINSLPANTLYRANTDQTVTENTTVSMHALEIADHTVASGGSGSTVLSVGPNAADTRAGVVFNGGSIETTELAFGASEGVIYTGDNNGTVSANITGSAGLTTFGSGTLELNASAGNTYSGTTSIHGGTLLANNASGSATGSGNVNVGSRGILEVRGTVGTGSMLLSVNSGATLSLNGGNVNGDVDVSELGVLEGFGTISGTTTFSNDSLIQAGDNVGLLSFEGSVALNDSITIWKLTQPTDNSDSVAIPDWNNFAFDDTITGKSTVLFEFGFDNPDTDNSFWFSDHEWLLLEDTSGLTRDLTNHFSLGTKFFKHGSFAIEQASTSTQWNLVYTYVPEPSTGSLLFGAALAWCWRRRQSNGRTNNTPRAHHRSAA